MEQVVSAQVTAAGSLMPTQYLGNQRNLGFVMIPQYVRDLLEQGL